MKIPNDHPRTWISTDADLSNIETLEPLLQIVEQKLESSSSITALEQWLAESDELFAAIDECRTRRYIAMTCQTDDPEHEKAYLHFVETIDPWLKPKQFDLLKQLTRTPSFHQLPSFYFLFQRSVSNSVDLFRPANVPRETELAKLSQSYQKIIGSMTVQFEGREQTLPQIAKILEEPDRQRRQSSWESSTRRRLENASELESLFDHMLDLRKAVATEAGSPDYRHYAFRSRERFDYTPEDCLQFHSSIEKCFCPLVRALQQERSRKLNVTPLRPWDLGTDPDNHPPLRPFASAAELLSKCETIFQKIDPRLGTMAALLREKNLVDLENRKGKAPGGYQATLEEARLPFIFMNAVGTQRDVETLLHEGGHAFHALASREQPLYAYRNSPIEFAEVASMSMELFAGEFLSEFYNPEEQRRARRDHLQGILKIFPWIAMVDAFQHWIYTHPNPTAEERSRHWLALYKRFGGIEDWSGWEKAHATTWHRQLHIFEYPFYYIEYGIAQLGALQMWRRFKQDPKSAVDSYLHALSLGGSEPLPKLFEATGIRFDFTEKAITPLTEQIQGELENLK